MAMGRDRGMGCMSRMWCDLSADAFPGPGARAAWGANLCMGAHVTHGGLKFSGNYLSQGPEPELRFPQGCMGRMERLRHNLPSGTFPQGRGQRCEPAAAGQPSAAAPLPSAAWRPPVSMQAKHTRMQASQPSVSACKHREGEERISQTQGAIHGNIRQHPSELFWNPSKIYICRSQRV